MTRRTPKLTAKARELWWSAYNSGRFVWGETVVEIAGELGLTPGQVRDAIWGTSDGWLGALYKTLRHPRNEAG